MFLILRSFLNLLHFLFTRLDISIMLRFQFQEFFFGLKVLFFLYGFSLYVCFFYKVFGIFLCIVYDKLCFRIERAFREKYPYYGPNN